MEGALSEGNVCPNGKTHEDIYDDGSEELDTRGKGGGQKPVEHYAGAEQHGVVVD